MNISSLVYLLEDHKWKNATMIKDKAHFQVFVIKFADV